ncbi:NAD(P)-binding domain-containing protein [Alcaligenaceae bacterium CGII-47]|nr:NAD(P)-binding domain-containing protein [Alcaligenaceae bacterium CGII-47]
MTPGFIGTGIITEAIVTGALRAHDTIRKITISPRGAAIAARLAQASPLVKIAADNQAVIDESDVVFLAIRPQIAEEVIRSLKFSKSQRVVSLIAAVQIETLASWIDAEVTITRAIPLPFVADLQGVTAIYPPSREVTAFFAPLGAVLEAQTLEEFDLFGVASALMGSYFGIMETTARWFERQGMPYDSARAYLGPIFLSLSQAAVQEPVVPFKSLRSAFSTKGGLNEQMFEVFDRSGGMAALTQALDQVLARVRAR